LSSSSPVVQLLLWRSGSTSSPSRSTSASLGHLLLLHFALLIFSADHPRSNRFPIPIFVYLYDARVWVSYVEDDALCFYLSSSCLLHGLTDVGLRVSHDLFICFAFIKLECTVFR
jgi:hypothetical protein